MHVTITGRGVVLTADVRALVERKVGKLARLLPQAPGARVVCGAEKFRRTARISVRVRRRAFATQATAADLAAAVEAAVDALRRQLREHKIRRRQPRRRPPAAA
ncbi:MAG: ribosome hibernation-promoting factor, HPF/YfiA family [Candidatus Rokuibacteriota bacterium]